MRLLRRIRYFFRQQQMERELAEEMAFHRAANGDPRGMGNVTFAREDARAVWIWPWLQSVCQDIGYALRNSLRQPGFTLIVLLTLGVTIGFNTSFFALYDAVILRPWPVRKPNEMVKVFAASPNSNRRAGPGSVGVPEYRYLAAHTRTFAGLTLVLDTTVHFGFEEFGESTKATLVAADHFRILGVNMHLGRSFLAEEDLSQDPQPVMVLSYALWRDHFGSDAQITTKKIYVDDIPFQCYWNRTGGFHRNLAGARVRVVHSFCRSVAPSHRAFLADYAAEAGNVPWRKHSGQARTESDAQSGTG